MMILEALLRLRLRLRLPYRPKAVTVRRRGSHRDKRVPLPEGRTLLGALLMLQIATKKLIRSLGIDHIYKTSW